MSTVKKRRPEKQPVAVQPQLTVEIAGVLAGVDVQETAAEKPLRPSQCRAHLRKTVAAAFRDIVTGFVDEAKRGSCQHLKMATEMVEPKKREEAASREKGPAELMLEELNRE